MTIAPAHGHPKWGDLPAAIHGLGARFGLRALEQRHSSRAMLGTYVLINSAISIAILSVVAMVTKQPFIFPSLGPTAFLLLYAATNVQAAPRSAFFGHLIGVLAGYTSLVVFGLTTTAPDLEDVTWDRVGAATMSLCLTLSVMVWLGVPHAPAGATTLIVSLGLLRTPEQLTVLMLAVVLLLVQGFLINRLAGLPYPVWAPRPQPE